MLIISETQAALMRQGADYYRRSGVVPLAGDPWLLYGAFLASFLDGGMPVRPDAPGPALPAPLAPQGTQQDPIEVQLDLDLPVPEQVRLLLPPLPELSPVLLYLANGQTLQSPGFWRVLMQGGKGRRASLGTL